MLWADLFYVVVIAYALAGLGIEIFNVLWFTATQREVPTDHLARVSSFDFLCSYGLAPVGLALIVPMADVFGQNAVLIGCAAICVVAPILAAVLPSSKHMSRDQG
jgi:MFS family permease